MRGITRMEAVLEIAQFQPADTSTISRDTLSYKLSLNSVSVQPTHL